RTTVLFVFVALAFFFFQAEDGIRDRNVTGVQTCALPISGDRVFTSFIKDSKLQTSSLPRNPSSGTAQEIIGICKGLCPRNEIVMRDHNVIEVDVGVLHDAQAHFSGNFLRSNAVFIHLYDEALDRIILDIPGKADGEVSKGSSPNPAFLPINYPTVLGSLRCSSQAPGNIRAVVRLSQSKAPQLFK